jgi:SAM-dependent methyltransferase
VTIRPGGSYDPSTTTAGGAAGELVRLDAQVALTWSEELRVLTELGVGGVGDGRLLDVGCGSGAMTARLNDSFPGRRLIGVDADKVLIRHAAAVGLPLLVARAENLPLRTASHDVAVARYVFQHLSQPGPVVAELRRVLRPGGLLAIVDLDAQLWGLAEPNFAEFAPVHRRVATAQAAAGGDRFVGRRLTRLLRHEGFTDVVVRPFATTSDDIGVDAFALHLGPDRLAPLVETGAVSLADLAAVTRGWARFRADPSAWVMTLGLVIAGRAPPA